MKIRESFLEKPKEYLINNNNHIKNKKNKKISSFIISDNKIKWKSIKVNDNSKENYYKLHKIIPQTNTNSNWNKYYNEYLKSNKSGLKNGYNLEYIKNINNKKKLNKERNKNSSNKNISLEKLNKNKRSNHNKSSNIKINKINTSLIEDKNNHKIKYASNLKSNTNLNIKIASTNEFKKSYEEETNTSKKNKIKNTLNLNCYETYLKNNNLENITNKIFDEIKTNNTDFFETCNYVNSSYKKYGIVESNEKFYQINEMIGKGNFGKVYWAKQILTNTDVAIKIISKEKIRSKDNKNKVELEIKLLRRSFGHNNIIKLYEFFENSKYIFLVFEYCANKDILKYLKEKGTMNEIQAMRVIYQILLGLKFLHKKSIFHRDIKLDNILLGNKLKCLIGDFGISLWKKDDEIITDTAGTPAYLAPEILKARGKANFKSDIWSAGVLLYSIIFGCMPFKSKNVQEVYKLILKGKYKFPDSFIVSHDLYDLIRSMLTYDIDNRPSVEEVLTHKWFKKDFLIDLNNKNLNFFDIKNLNKDKVFLIKYLLWKFGFNNDYIEESLKRKKINHLTSCFYVLYNKVNL